jgi:hypothetical protein
MFADKSHTLSFGVNGISFEGDGISMKDEKDHIKVTLSENKDADITLIDVLYDEKLILLADSWKSSNWLARGTSRVLRFHKRDNHQFLNVILKMSYEPSQNSSLFVKRVIKVGDDSSEMYMQYIPDIKHRMNPFSAKSTWADRISPRVDYADLIPMALGEGYPDELLSAITTSDFREITLSHFKDIYDFVHDKCNDELRDIFRKTFSCNFPPTKETLIVLNGLFLEYPKEFKELRRQYDDDYCDSL